MAQQNNKKFLIGCPSPRDIPQVAEALDKVDFIDKFYAKYMPEWRAYPAIRDFFLEYHYDYLIIWADDLIATPRQIMQLVADVTEGNYDVIGGVCQIDNTFFKEFMAVSRKPFYPSRNNRWRPFEKFADYYDEQGELLPKWQDKPIIKTKWQGFPLTCISRPVMQLIAFENDAAANNLPKEQGCCTDDMFCWACIQDEIEMYTDLRIRANHLRKDENSYKLISWKGKEPHFKFENGKTQLKIYEIPRFDIKSLR